MGERQCEYRDRETEKTEIDRKTRRDNQSFSSSSLSSSSRRSVLLSLLPPQQRTHLRQHVFPHGDASFRRAEPQLRGLQRLRQPERQSHLFGGVLVVGEGAAAAARPGSDCRVCVSSRISRSGSRITSSPSAPTTRRSAIHRSAIRSNSRITTSPSDSDDVAVRIVFVAACTRGLHATSTTTPVLNFLSLLFLFHVVVVVVIVVTVTVAPTTLVILILVLVHLHLYFLFLIVVIVVVVIVFVVTAI
jgi:hypothetical protein